MTKRYRVQINSGNLPAPIYLVVGPSQHHVACENAELGFTLDAALADIFGDKHDAATAAHLVGRRHPKWRTMVEVVEVLK